jgi:hypothetical protein
MSCITIVILALICLAIPILAADAKPADPPKLTDAEKLAIRDAQVAALAAQGQIITLQRQMEAAQKKLEAAVTAAKAAHGCEDVTMDLVCVMPKPKPTK